MNWDEFSDKLNAQDYTNSFVSLIRAIHSQTSQPAVGMPDALLIEKDRQSWTMLKARLIPDTVSEAERAAAEMERLLQDQMAQLQRNFPSLAIAMGNSALGQPQSDLFINPSFQNV